MIFGELIPRETTLETHNDNYMLAGLTAISIRRPFLSTGLLIGGLIAAFNLSFSDLLYPSEFAALALAAILSVVGGLSIGQLRLVSRDLRGSPIAEVVYGTYGHLNRMRPQIVDAVERAKSGGAS